MKPFVSWCRVPSRPISLFEFWGRSACFLFVVTFLCTEDGLFTFWFPSCPNPGFSYESEFLAVQCCWKLALSLSPHYPISRSSLTMCQHTCPYDLYYSILKKHTPENKPSKTSLRAFRWAIKLKWLMTDSSKDQNQCEGVDVITQPWVGKERGGVSMLFGWLRCPQTCNLRTQIQTEFCLA